MAACTEAGCDGAIAVDGYCDTCGMAASRSAAGSRGAAAPNDPTGAVCTQGGCDGEIAPDGYCDTCGMRGVAGPSDGVGRTGSHAAATGPSIAAPSAPTTSARTGPTSRRTTRSSSRSGARLGAGLVTILPTEVGDPAGAVMSAEKIAGVLGEVPEEDRNCSTCGRPVGRTLDGRPGRVEGFCSNCRTAFNFHTNAPALQAGDLVGGQYEILGPLAHGGMGWIYLGRDKAVSDRWVVLKGLLNEDDPDAAAAAVAERRFLAQIEHPNIVNIYNFVTHLGRGYIVMEFVGGASLNSKLKDRRRANAGRPDPLPVADAMSYIIGILPAFEYLHGLGVVYNDLKPANIMAVGGDVKLIDVGAVMRATDQDAAIFGTQGFQAPEMATAGPSVSSDLYTVGRTLAVLLLNFVFHTGDYEHAIPPPREFGVLRQWESLHRFLLKATAMHPADRFQTAGEMTEQLTGVLREVVAVTAKAPRPTPSRLFGGDQLTSLLVADAELAVTASDWRTLPVPKVDPADAAAAFLEDLAELDPAEAVTLIDAAVAEGQVVATIETELRRARAAIQLGADPRVSLETVAETDPWDWRIEWYRSVDYLVRGEHAAAAEGFSRVWTELPGEIAPRLGAAMAAEAAGELERAAELFEQVISIDATYVSAAFGLARTRVSSGDRPGAVDALHAVPPSSATYEDAQVAAARTLLGDGQPSIDQISEAARTVERLQLDAAERVSLSAEILEGALAALGRLDKAPDTTVLGHRLDRLSVRAGLESVYREQARLAVDPAEKVRLVDQANQVRPRTLV